MPYASERNMYQINNNNNFVKKGLVFGIIVLFVGASLAPSIIGTAIEKQISKENNSSLMVFNPRGNILYVGGSGSGNYSKIQNAIDNASDGDTIYVYSGVYYEHNIIINKSITLIGENKNSTIIDGSGIASVLTITDDEVTVRGFTIQNASNSWYDDFMGYPHLLVQSSHNTISQNIFTYPNNHSICCGIYIGGSSSSDYNIISENKFINQDFGIVTRSSSENVIEKNNITETFIGIQISSSSGSVISENQVLSLHGILVYDSDNIIIINNQIICVSDEIGTGSIQCSNSKNNIIVWNNITGFTRGIAFCWERNSNASYNTIKDCYKGFQIQTCNNVTIYMNDIINCTIDIYSIYEPGYNMSICSLQNKIQNTFKKNNLGKGFKNVLFLFTSYIANNWESNYWGRPRLLPKLILARRKITGDLGIPTRLQFDWHPAQEPYDIPRIAI